MPVTVEQFVEMHAAGRLDPDLRYELLDGDVVAEPPITPLHGGTVTRISYVFVLPLRGRGSVRIKNPLVLPPQSQLEPDILLARYRRDFYKGAHPTAGDALVAIEVSESTTLPTDRSIKLPIYARQGVPEVWIVNLEDEVVEIYSRPTGDGYAELRTLSGAEKFAPGAFPDFLITAADLLGDG